MQTNLDIDTALITDALQITGLETTDQVIELAPKTLIQVKDDFNGHNTPQVDQLDQLLVTQPIAIGDVILTEVLQGQQCPFG